MRKKKVVTVFGSSGVEPLDDLYRAAFELGGMIADLGLTLCNGGYGGTMEASARGAAEAGGHTIGVTCTRFPRSGPNPYIRQEIPTFDLFQRLQTLIRLGRAYVAFPGGTGTLAELALVWELLNKGMLGGNRPLIVFGEAWQPVIDCIERAQPTATKLHKVSDVSAARAILAELAS